MAKSSVFGKVAVFSGVIIVLGGASAYYFTRPKPSQFQIAYVAKGSVVQTLNVDGTISPTVTNSVAPPTSGTVLSVPVTLGQSVQTGATLATISPSSRTVDQIAAAQASLAQAQATLTQVQSETTSTTTSTTVPVNPTAQLLVQINQSIAQLKPVCITPACQTQLSSLDALVQQLNGANKQSNSSSATPRNATPPPPSSAEISADQAIVAADQIAVNNAQASIPSDVMTSPITGVVAAIGLSVGEDVTPNASTYDVTVISPTSWQAQANVLANDLPDLKVGDSVSVLIAGQTSRNGTVSSIGTTATIDPTTGNVTFPVVVNLSGSNQGLFDGSSASITIETLSVANVVTVPTSAISRNGNNYQLQILTAPNQTKNITVHIGAFGPNTTQITNGVNVGQPVVLANIATPIPTPTLQLGALRRAFGGGAGGGAGGRGAKKG